MPLSPPQPEGWEIATAYRAARVVGGDFYDVFELPGTDREGAPAVGFVVADVTGKGLTAALMMAFTRAVLRAASYNGTGPSDALERTNRVLVRDARTGLFVTAIAARLDPDRGELAYASAGHEPPLLARARDNGVIELEAGGTLLGIAEHAPGPDTIVDLEPGDLLVVYTDGITDAARSHTETGEAPRFGIERLIEAIAAARGLDAVAAVASIVARVESFVGSAEQADDFTLLAVRRSPQRR
jgi:serine phosphatase RsbU (regulator of sigma subunit)